MLTSRFTFLFFHLKLWLYSGGIRVAKARSLLVEIRNNMIPGDILINHL